MNKRSVKKRPVKTSRRQSGRKTVSRRVVSKPEQTEALSISAVGVVARQMTVHNAFLRSHKFRVGQTVLYTSSPITRPGASGAYKVVKLLPSDGDDYQYRIKNSGEAFERVAKESQLELEH
jgi:hypothetical protein